MGQNVRVDQFTPRQGKGKKKVTLMDYIMQAQREEAQSEKAVHVPVHATRSLQAELLAPLIDLSYTEHVEVQRDAAAVLATLSVDSDNRRVLVKAGCLRPLLGLCASRDIRIRRDAWAALANLTAKEEILRRIVEINGLPQLISASASQDSVIMRCTSECISNVAGSLVLRGHLVQAGGLQRISELITSHDSQVRRLALTSLHRLVTPGRRTKDDPEGDGFAKALHLNGILVMLARLLIRHDVSTQSQVLSMFTTIIEANDDNRAFLADSAVLQSLITLVGRADQPEDMQITREAAKLFERLGASSELRSAMIAEGALPVILALGRVDNVSLRQSCALILETLAHDYACKQAIVDAGSTRVLSSLARSIHKRISRPASHAIEKLTQNDDIASQLMGSQLLTTVILNCSSTDEVVQTYATDALAKMCETPGNGLVLLTKGVLPALAAPATKRSGTLTFLASKALVALASQSEEVACELAYQGVTRVIAPILYNKESKTLRNSLQVLRLICESLEILASDELGTQKEMAEQQKRKPKIGSAFKQAMMRAHAARTPAEVWLRLSEEDNGRAASRLRVLSRMDDELGHEAVVVLNMLRPVEEEQNALYQAATLVQKQFRGNQARARSRQLYESKRADEMKRRAEAELRFVTNAFQQGSPHSRRRAGSMFPDGLQRDTQRPTTFHKEPSLLINDDMQRPASFHKQPSHCRRSIAVTQTVVGEGSARPGSAVDLMILAAHTRAVQTPLSVPGSPRRIGTAHFSHSSPSSIKRRQSFAPSPRRTCHF